MSPSSWQLLFDSLYRGLRLYQMTLKLSQIAILPVLTYTRLLKEGGKQTICHYLSGMVSNYFCGNILQTE